MNSPQVLGIMSGTSADGIDVVLLELTGWARLGSTEPFIGPFTGPFELAATSAGVPRGRVLAHQFSPYDAGTRQLVLQAMRGELGTPALTQLHWHLGELYAQAAAPHAPQAELIACHGQTVQHHPVPNAARGWEQPATLQLGEAAVIAERTGRRTVADFRPADLAAGGVGAPLVPFADWALFAQDTPQVLLNIGGIANLTYLPGLERKKVQAFDIGPGNCLLDEIAAHLGQTYDQDGRIAASGQVHEPTLQAWLAHPELQQPPPKATGREVWTLERLAYPKLSWPDLAATACRFTAQCVAGALRFLPLDAATKPSILVAGGGAQNPVLMRELQDALAPLAVQSFSRSQLAEYGFNDHTREAAAFAFLGYCRAQGWPNTLPHCTGAKHAVLAGKILEGGVK